MFIYYILANIVLFPVRAQTYHDVYIIVLSVDNSKRKGPQGQLSTTINPHINKSP